MTEVSVPTTFEHSTALPAPIAEAVELMATRLGERVARMSAADAKSFIDAGLVTIDQQIAGLPEHREYLEAIRHTLRERVHHEFGKRGTAWGGLASCRPSTRIDDSDGERSEHRR